MKKYVVFCFIFLTSCSLFKTEYTKDEVVVRDGIFYSKKGELITGNIVHETDSQKIIQTMEEGKVIKAEVFKKKEGSFIRKQSFEYSPTLGNKYYYDNGLLKLFRTSKSVIYYKETGEPLLSIQWPSNTHPKEFNDVKFICFSKDGTPKNIDKNKKEAFIKNYFNKIKLLEFEEKINLDESCEAYAVDM